MSDSIKNIRLEQYNGIIDELVVNEYYEKDIELDENDTVTWKKSSKSEMIEETIPPYFPGDDLIAAVQYARLLNRPLLIRGEPGCGKTKLAQAIAYELYKDSEKNYRDFYFEWHIKSTTKAQEGLFKYDHLARLRAIQHLAHKDKLSESGDKKKIDPAKKDVDKIVKKDFRTFGALAKAILASDEEHPAVLLIDEIDKADIDFPNDLLLELDQKRFYIEETQETFSAKAPPIIIITSNDEKELPNAFLRRCVFHYIEFPDRKLLLKIVDSKVKEIISDFKESFFPDATASNETFQAEVVDVFRGLLAMTKNNPKADKHPSTSELLDWLKVIHFAKLKDPSKFKVIQCLKMNCCL